MQPPLLVRISRTGAVRPLLKRPKAGHFPPERGRSRLDQESLQGDPAEGAREDWRRVSPGWASSWGRVVPSCGPPAVAPAPTLGPPGLVPSSSEPRRCPWKVPHNNSGVFCWWCWGDASGIENCKQGSKNSPESVLMLKTCWVVFRISLRGCSI